MNERQSDIPAGAIFAILILIFLVACWLEARQPVAVERHNGIVVSEGARNG